jgi:glycosyltransferase involved in cell wall biosynthesis
MSRKVLIISYYFPPSGGAGVQRVLKLVKYLPEFGWQPIVLTVDEEADFPARDPSLLAEIPAATPVHRTRIFEPYGLYRKWTGKSKSDAIDIMTNASGTGGSTAEKISRWVRATFFIPDARRFWKRPALAEAEKILLNGPVDLILSSAPPYTCHLIGMALHERHRIPWIADFRDSWVGWLSAPIRWRLPDRIDRGLERRVLSRADGLVSVSNGVMNDLMSRNSEIPRDKWRLIPNGFDAADFEGMATGASEGRFIWTYSGSLYGKRNPAAFLGALESLFAERPDYRLKMLFRFVGRLDPLYLDAFRRLGDAFEHIPYVPHRESLGYLLNSSALLLIIDEAAAAASIVTGKIYEYLASRKPILALAPEGDAADLIRGLNAGRVASPGDAEGVKAVMKEWMESWLAGRPIPHASVEAVRPFERRTQAGEMAAFFEEIVGRTGSAKA